MQQQRLALRMESAAGHNLQILLYVVPQLVPQHIPHRAGCRVLCQEGRRMCGGTSAWHGGAGVKGHQGASTA